MNILYKCKYINRHGESGNCKELMSYFVREHNSTYHKSQNLNRKFNNVFRNQNLEAKGAKSSGNM